MNLQAGEAAAQLVVDRTTLSKVLNGRAAISPAMALRIERWLGRDHAQPKFGLDGNVSHGIRSLA